MNTYLVTNLNTGETLRLFCENEQEAYYRAIDFWSMPWDTACYQLNVELYHDNWLAEHWFSLLWMLVAGAMIVCLLIVILLGPEGLRHLFGL